MTTVYIRHLRTADLCTKGARHWFKERGLSWDQFIEQGISSDVLEALDDPLGMQVLEIARKEAVNGR